MKYILLTITLFLYSCTQNKVYQCTQIHYTSESFDTTYFSIVMNQNQYNTFIQSNNTSSKCNFLTTKCK